MRTIRLKAVEAEEIKLPGVDVQREEGSDGATSRITFYVDGRLALVVTGTYGLNVLVPALSKED